MLSSTLLWFRKFWFSGLPLIALLLAVPSAYSTIDRANLGTPTPGAFSLHETPGAAIPATQIAHNQMKDFFVGATVNKAEDVERYTWDDTAVDFSGFGLVPVSLTVGDFEGSVWLFAEFRNDTNASLIAPMLDFEAKLGGKGFGTQRAWANQYEVAPGGSATYIGWSLYAGSILYGDWDTFSVTFTEYPNSPELSIEGLRIDSVEGKLFNEGTQDRSRVMIEGIMRDSAGAFVGVCSVGTVDATVPAGLFVRIPESISLNTGPVSTCANYGARAFAEQLGTTPVSITEFILVIPRP